jgi:hypothetical protein
MSHFLNENKLELKLKTVFELRGVLGIVGKP